MGLFNMFKKEKTTSDTNNQIVEAYDTPVEEIDAPLPVGNLEAIKPVAETPVLLFDEVSNPTNASNMFYKEIGGNQCIVNGNSTANEFGHLFNNNPNVEGPVPTVSEPQPTVIGQIDNGLNAIESINNETDDENRENRFFVGEVDNSKIYKKKEEVSPISASTDIFNIGKIPTSDDSEYGVGRTR